MKTKLADIARTANVSVSAVSLALNNQPGVSREIAEKIVRIATDLGYRPQKNRAKGGARTIQFIKVIKHGEILNGDHQPFIADYMDGILSASTIAGFSVEIVSFSGGDMGEVVQRIRSSRVAGAIVLATELDAADIGAFEACECPVVFLDAYFDYYGLDLSDTNNTDSVHLAVRHLVEMGHRTIGLIQGRVRTPNFVAREKAFVECLADLGFSLNPRHLISVGSRFQTACTDMAEALDRLGSDLPTAFFCVNDIIALGCMRAMTERGIAIPDDVSIVGFDNLGAGEMSAPPLTSINVSKQLIARRAVMLLEARIQNGTRFPVEKIKISGEIVLRESVRDRRNKE
jgi:DNA-binding LacI/PurR family transcriptional regulator